MIYITLYKLLELIDGERVKGFNLLPYRLAQRLKLLLLRYVR